MIAMLPFVADVTFPSVIYSAKCGTENNMREFNSTRLISLFVYRDRASNACLGLVKVITGLKLSTVSCVMHKNLQTDISSFN